MTEPKRRIKVNLSHDEKQRLQSLSYRLGLGGKYSPCLRYCLADWDRKLYCGDRREVDGGKKRRPVQIDVTEDEYKNIKSRSLMLGLSVSALYRLAFLRMEATKLGKRRPDQFPPKRT